MTDLTGRKPILCLDFDGVCHMYTSGWKGAGVIPDDPVPGVFDFIRSVCEDFEIAIFSSRSTQAGGIDAMYAWFEKHSPGITGELTFPIEKPPAFIGIDDRVLTFTGAWPTLAAIKAFKTWTSKGMDV